MKPACIDTHVHLDLDDFNLDRDLVLPRAGEAGVQSMITVGINRSSSRQAVALAEQYPQVFAAVGIHPHEARNATAPAYDELKDLAANQRVVAVGETGLDFFKEYSPRREQEICFRRQIGLAKELRLPLVIHDREAHDRIIEILREEKAEEVGGVFHCFSGDYALARSGLDMGFYISVSGVITFPRATGLREVVEKMPLDRLLVETDAPFLAPVPYRGKRNEPAYVIHVVRKLAEVKKVSVSEVAQCTQENARVLFKLPVP